MFTGFATDALLRALYQQTALFAYPSRYEGFGLPVVEASRCGAPAIVANAPGLREVVPWQPAQFDPDDAEALGGLIERGLCDQSFRSRLLDLADETAHSHTWERVAQRTDRGVRTAQPSGSAPPYPASRDRPSGSHSWGRSRRRGRESRNTTPP